MSPPPTLLPSTTRPTRGGQEAGPRPIKFGKLPAIPVADPAGGLCSDERRKSLADVPFIQRERPGSMLCFGGIGLLPACLPACPPRAASLLY